MANDVNDEEMAKALILGLHIPDSEEPLEPIMEAFKIIRADERNKIWDEEHGR